MQKYTPVSRLFGAALAVVRCPRVVGDTCLLGVVTVLTASTCVQAKTSSIVRLPQRVFLERAGLADYAAERFNYVHRCSLIHNADVILSHLRLDPTGSMRNCT